MGAPSGQNTVSEHAVRPIEPADLVRLRTITDVQISPDGDRVAYVVRTADPGRDCDLTALWLYDIRSGHHEQLTDGGRAEAAPKWSPSGRQLAFTQRCSADGDQADGTRQLYVIDLDTRSAPRQLTDFDDDVSAEPNYPVITESYAWSPDGSWLCVATKDGPRTRKRVFAHDRLAYKMGDLGWWDGRRKHLWRAPVDGGTPTRLTGGDWDCYGPAVAPDGRHVAYISAERHRTERHNSLPDTNPLTRRDIWVLDTATANRWFLRVGDGPWLTPSFSPDGRSLAFFGHDDPAAGWSRPVHLWVATTEGDDARDVLADWDYTCGSIVMSDVHDVFAPPPAVWSPDGQRLCFLGTARGASNVYSVTLDGEVTPVTTGDHEVVTVSVDATSSRFAAVIGDETAPGELHVGSFDGELERVTQLNDAVLRDVSTSKAERITFSGGDGWQIDGLVLRPPGEPDAASRRPLVLEVLPGSQFVHGRSFNFEYQLLASNGYVVVHVNPRGAGSFGSHFSRAGATVGDYFGKNVDDLMAAVDTVVAQGGVDEKRLGLTGDASGGAMTNWLITQTDRFAASVARRAAANMYAAAMTGDRAGVRAVGGVPSLADVDAMFRRSPVAHAADVTTPHLIIHSIGDLRSPVTLAEELFVALRSLGKTARLVLFDNDVHFLSRMGRPSDKVEFFRLILEWFDLHLADRAKEGRGDP